MSSNIAGRTSADRIIDRPRIVQMHSPGALLPWWPLHPRARVDLLQHFIPLRLLFICIFIIINGADLIIAFRELECRLGWDKGILFSLLRAFRAPDDPSLIRSTPAGDSFRPKFLIINSECLTFCSRHQQKVE